jgi:succinoglycan biosynthesis protein ExoM
MSTAARIIFFARALAQALVAAVCALMSWPMGRHHAARWLTKLWANIGKMSAFWGWRYREYA